MSWKHFFLVVFCCCCVALAAPALAAADLLSITSEISTQGNIVGMTGQASTATTLKSAGEATYSKCETCHHQAEPAVWRSYQQHDNQKLIVAKADHTYVGHTLFVERIRTAAEMAADSTAVHRLLCYKLCYEISGGSITGATLSSS